MARVTDYYNLGATQGSVDFVDVDVEGDVPVYIDPTAIRNQGGEWSNACVDALQSFFRELLKAIKLDDLPRLQELVFPLVEPNETHLGESRGQSRGRSLGSRKKANELIDSLRSSRAVASGFLHDLEDTALMVEGIDKDIVSDITTCVIRHELIYYTQKQCDFHGIPMELQDSGPAWNGDLCRWMSEDVLLPRADGNRLLLVPRAIVRARLTVDTGKYYRGYLRPFFEEDALNGPRTSLVKVLKDGSLVVDKTELDRELGTTKRDVIVNTEKHPQALDKYRVDLSKGEFDRGPLTNQDFGELNGTPIEDPREILQEIRAIAPGTAGATLYHRSVARLLTALFSTSLGNQRIERELHSGMKRIDITYDNVARAGFFWWLRSHYPSAMVVVECKNYGKDAGNPEFDQIAMRFSDQRGRVGLLTCRQFDNKQKALDRAGAIARDGHGFVIVLDDDDLERLIGDLEEAEGDPDQSLAYPLLRSRFGLLVGA